MIGDQLKKVSCSAKKKKSIKICSDLDGVSFLTSLQCILLWWFQETQVKIWVEIFSFQCYKLWRKRSSAARAPGSTWVNSTRAGQEWTLQALTQQWFDAFSPFFSCNYAFWNSGQHFGRNNGIQNRSCPPHLHRWLFSIFYFLKNMFREKRRHLYAMFWNPSDKK